MNNWNKKVHVNGNGKVEMSVELYNKLAKIVNIGYYLCKMNEQFEQEEKCQTKNHVNTKKN